MLSEAIFKLDNENNSCHWHQSRTISNTQNIFFRYFASCIRIVFGRRKNENMSKNLKKLLQLYTEISYSSTLTPLQFSCTLNSLSTTNMDDIVFRTVGEYVFQSFIWEIIKFVVQENIPQFHLKNKFNTSKLFWTANCT